MSRYENLGAKRNKELTVSFFFLYFNVATWNVEFLIFDFTSSWLFIAFCFCFLSFLFFFCCCLNNRRMTWNPTVLAGYKSQYDTDSFQYRPQNGVVSFALFVWLPSDRRPMPFLSIALPCLCGRGCLLIVTQCPLLPCPVCVAGRLPIVAQCPSSLLPCPVCVAVAAFRSSPNALPHCWVVVYFIILFLFYSIL